MIELCAPNYTTYQSVGLIKYQIAELLGGGTHEVQVVIPGPPVRLDIYGPDYDHQDRPDAAIEATHPDIEGISWTDILEALMRQLPRASDDTGTETENEYQAIKESIAKYGILQRVIVDETGNIISGKLRRRACQELELPCPTEVISGLTHEQKKQLSYELDYCRKHLSLNDKRRCAEFILKANPRNTDRVLGRACGLDHKTIGVLRDDLEERGEIPQVEQRQGGDGKTYRFPKIVANTEKEEVRAKSSLLTLGDDVPSKPIDLKRAEELVRIRRAKVKKDARSRTPILPNDSIQIVHSDFRNLQIEDESAHLIFTDPQYHKDSLSLWKDLADFAARKLRPGGLLVAYSGTIYLPDVFAALSARLQYVWQRIVLHNGGSQYVYDRRVGNMYKPLLVFSRGKPSIETSVVDVINGHGAEKEFHRWQQNIDEALQIITEYTQPGELVVDPFGGGFTTAAACYRLGRNCLSCDIDADAVKNGLDRLAEEQARTKSD